jgi:hypothetical protein
VYSYSNKWGEPAWVFGPEIKKKQAVMAEVLPMQAQMAAR